MFLAPLAEVNKLPQIKKKKVQYKTVEELEREAEVLAKKAQRGCCGIVFVPFGDLPDLPGKNLFQMEADHLIRRRCLNLAVNPYLQGFCLLCSLVHFVLALPEVQSSVFMCKRLKDLDSDRLQQACSVELPFFHHFLFLGVYVVEAAVKITAFGFSGAKFAYWTRDVYNKFDFVATVGYLIEIIVLLFVNQAFTLRALRLFRILKPISRLWLFSDLEIIFHALGSAMLPMLTIMSLVLFSFILLSIVGMSMYGEKSFRRRCVWADDLTLKQPEAFCWRADSIGLSTEGSCGPMQLCADYDNPNLGFTSFDHMPGSMLALFQTFSTDGQYQIFWVALQSEPAYAFISYIFFVTMGFGLGHVLINVFVAVFANVFSQSRVNFKMRNDEHMEEAAAAGLTAAHGGSGSGSSNSSGSSSAGSTSRSSAISPRSSNSRLSAAAQETAKFASLEDQVRHIKLKEIDPLLQTYMIWLFRNKVYEIITLVIIVGQACSLVLIGSMCTYEDGQKCWFDEMLIEVTNNCNLFFMFDFVMQVLCDGSLSKHFENGEYIYNFLITITTSTAVIGSALGLQNGATSVLRGFAIFRLWLVCKYGILKPVWLMLVKTADSIVPIVNLALFNLIFSLAWYVLGRILFKDTLTDINLRSNFSSISRGYMLLFQLMTGDSWAGLMYEGMSVFCPSSSPETCDKGYSSMAAFYYIIYFFYGQFIFITMFLAVILESFAVQEFMDIGSVEEEVLKLAKEECSAAVAEFHMLPEELVSKRLLHRAWVLLSEGGKVHKHKLIAFYQINDARTFWRFMKASGIVYMLQVLRLTILFPCSSMLGLKPYPGDVDYVMDMNEIEMEKSMEDAIYDVAADHEEEIQDYMAELVERNMQDEVVMVAMRLGVVSSLDTIDLRGTPPHIAIEILRDPTISKRLHIDGYFEDLIEENMLRHASAPQRLGNDDEVCEQQEAVVAPGLDLLKSITLARAPKSVSGHIWKWIRVFAVAFTNSSAFDGLVLATIILSSVMLCLETPEVGIMEQQTRYMSIRFQFLLDIACTSVFCLEALSKIFSFGLWTPVTVDFLPYLLSKSNMLDLFVLLLALAEMVGIGQYIGTGTAKIVRLMKVLRPLRLMTRSEGLKKIIIALAASVKPMAYAVIFLTLVIVVFSVTAMAFFARKFDRCTDFNLKGSIGEGKLECLGLFLSDSPENGGMLKPRAWLKPGFGSNFDTFFSSGLLLFRCITLKWVTFYAAAQDAPNQLNQQPVLGNSMITASIFFHLFILFASFFGMNLFVSFMCDAFYSIQGEDQLEELQWMSVQKMARDNYPTRPVIPPSNNISGMIRKILSSKWYKVFSVWCLMINIVFMSTAHAGQTSDYAEVLNIQNAIFFGQMCAEAFFYFVSVGPKLYLKDPLHQFDMLLIILTSITMIFSEEFRTMSQAVRILRLFKFGRALSQDRTISNVFETVIVSIGQVFNIVVVLSVLVMMYSVLAVQLFGLVKYQSRVGVQVNFATFPSALRSIFQLMFGDEWHLIQDDCIIQEPSCTPNIYDDPNSPNPQLLYASDCGGFASGVLFFPSFLILANYVVLNLFVGMIMNNFAYINCKDSNGVLEPDDFVKVSQVWVSKFDPKATGTIKLQDVYTFMIHIGEPLGFYGTEENVGRYLCVREELKQKMIYEEENPEKVGGWLYNWVKIHEESIYSATLEHWQHYQDALFECQQTLGEAEHELAAKREYFAEVEREQEADATGRNDQQEEQNQGQNEEKSDQELEDGKRGLHGISEDLKIGGDGTQIDNLKGGIGNKLVQESHDVCAETRVQNVLGGSFGRADSIRQQAWIGGGKMGLQHKTPAEIQQWHAQKDHELAMAHNDVVNARQHVEHAKALAREHPEPAISYRGKVFGFVREVLKKFIPKEKRSERRNGYVTYLNVMNALLHWNKRRNIVPGYLMETLKEKDDRVILDVAFQFVQATILGGVLRRRRRIAKEIANARLKKASQDTRRMAVTMGSTQNLVANRESNRLKALYDSHATPQAVQRYFNDPASIPQRIMCAKMALYGIAKGHTLAGLAIEAGVVDLEDQGIFSISDELLEPLMHHHTMIRYAQHVVLIDEVKGLVDNGQEPLLMLASQVHQIEWMHQVEDLPLTTLSILINDPNVQTVIANVESYNKGNGGKKNRTLCTELVPGGPGAHSQEALMLLDDSILDELEEIQLKIKVKETENEALSKTLEETQLRMFELREEHDMMVSHAAAAKAHASTGKEAAEHPSRVRRYDSSSAAASTVVNPHHPRPQSEDNHRSNHTAGPGQVAETEGLAAEVASASHSIAPNGDAHTPLENLSGANSPGTSFGEATENHDVSHRKPYKAPEEDLSSQIQNDPSKIQEQINAKMVEMRRLQKLLEKTRRDAARGDASMGNPEVFVWLCTYMGIVHI